MKKSFSIFFILSLSLLSIFLINKLYFKSVKDIGSGRIETQKESEMNGFLLVLKNNSDSWLSQELDVQWNPKLIVQVPPKWELYLNRNSDDTLEFRNTANNDYRLSFNPPNSPGDICVFDGDSADEIKSSFEKDFPGYFEEAAVYYDKTNDVDNVGDGLKYRRVLISKSDGPISYRVCKNHLYWGIDYFLPQPNNSNLETAGMLGVMDSIVLLNQF